MPSMTQSIEKLQKRLNKDPNSLVFVQLAEEHRKEGNLDEAMRILKGGLSRHPNYWSARVTLGRIHHQMGNRDGAREELEKVVAAVPDHLLANRLLGEIYMALNQPFEALKRLKMVQMITPADHALNDQIELLNAQIPPGPLPEPLHAPVLLPEVQVEPEAPEQTETPQLPAQVQEEMDEPQNEVYAPTIQIQIPDFLEKTEVPVELLQKNEPAQLQSSMPSMSEAESYPADRMEPAEPEMFESPLEQQSDSAVSSEDPYLPDTLIVDSAPQELDTGEREELDENFESASDSEELSSLANLLMSTEESMILQSGFDELDPAYSTERDVEPFVRTGHQDRTQPIQEEEEGLEEAEEFTTETLAELYLSQGLTDKALKVYQRLLLHDPDNPQLLNRLHELSGTPNPPTQAEVEFAEEVVSIENHEPEISAQTYQQEPPGRRAEERRRKIHTLENWLSSIRRERE